jgi:hypothetical protein
MVTRERGPELGCRWKDGHETRSSDVERETTRNRNRTGSGLRNVEPQTVLAGDRRGILRRMDTRGNKTVVFEELLLQYYKL